MAKFIEYVFRRWFWLVLSTVLVAGVTIFLSLQVPPQYQSDATFWTDRPTFLEYDLGWSPELSPAQNQINRLNQMVQLESFQNAMTKQIQKANVELPKSWKAKDLAKNFKFTSTYQNLIAVRSIASSPELARAQTQALFDTFQDYYQTQFQNYTNQVLKVYEQQIKDATTRFEQTDQALNQYLASHPTSLSEGGLPDFELDRIKSQNQTSIDQLAMLRGKMEVVRLQAKVGMDAAQNTLLRVEEAPNLPKGSQTSKALEMALYGVIGAMVGLGIGLVALGLASNGDRSFFRAKELSEVLGVPVYEMGQPPVAAKVEVIKPVATSASNPVELERSGQH